MFFWTSNVLNIKKKRIIWKWKKLYMPDTLVHKREVRWQGVQSQILTFQEFELWILIASRTFARLTNYLSGVYTRCISLACDGIRARIMCARKVWIKAFGRRFSNAWPGPPFIFTNFEVVPTSDVNLDH